MPFKSRAEAQAAAHRSWANTPDRAARTRNGRAAAWASVEAAYSHPDVAEKDREKAARNARRAFLWDMTMASAAIRKARKETPLE
jgi:hypothetical protein